MAHNAKSELLYEASNGVARITINRPEARNAFTFEMYEALAHHCNAVNSDELGQSAGAHRGRGKGLLRRHRYFSLPQLQYARRCTRL